MSDTVELELAWAEVAAGADRRLAAALLDDLVGRHRQPHRRYHGVRHIVWVLRHIDDLVADGCVVDRPVALAAAFFHDAVYDPQATDNEARSAVLADTQLRSLGWPEPRVAAVASIVRATAGHLVDANDSDDDGEDRDSSDVAAITRDPTCDVVLDADLGVLGADPAAYLAYTTGVRAEYGALDDDTWRQGRRAVVEALLGRRRLYRTAPARRRWGERARANLSGELASLRQ